MVDYGLNNLSLFLYNSTNVNIKIDKSESGMEKLLKRLLLK